jgi:non-specific serine/threonine protein kinase
LEENEILRALRSFPANRVYFLAPKDYILRGFDYYEQGHLKSFVWGKDGATLTAYVMGTRRYAVDISVLNGKPRFSCECPAWTPSSHCKHVICALLTAINILSPDLFLARRQNEGRRRLLQSELVGSRHVSDEEEPLSKREEGPYEIVIGQGETGPSISIRRDGVTRRTVTNAPPELAGFITWSAYASRFLEGYLSQYLTRYLNRYPLVLKTDEGEVPVQWDPSLTLQAKTELDVAGDDVEIRAVSFINGAACRKVHRFWNFVADLETRRFGQIKDTAGWTLYREMESLISSAQTTDDEDGGLDLGAQNNQGIFRVPVSRFQTFQWHLSKGSREDRLSDVLLKIQGVPARLFPAEHTYRLTVEPGEKEADRVILRTECRLGGSPGSPTAPVFRFFPYMEDHRGLPVPLRAQKRKAVIYPLFLKLLTTRKPAVDKIIREGLAEGDFPKRSAKRDARGILKHFYSAATEADARIRLHDGRWHIVPDEISQEALLYRIPCELFGPGIFRGAEDHAAMSIPAADLHEKLPSLYAALKASGIELFYRNKPVRTSRWDFAFDARKVSGIDWFEVRPEITCDGVRIDERQWQEILHRGGVVEREDVIQILDSNSQEILKSIAVIYRTEGKGKGEKKEIVRVPRLRILDWVTLRKQGVRVQLPKEDEELIQRLTRFETIEKTPLPKKLRAKLRPYQRQGYDWLAFHYGNRFGACLADDMGLGKTVQAISLLGGIREGVVKHHGPRIRDPHLVVLPPSLLFNWENEIARFYPDLKIHFYTGKERSTVFHDCDVVITTYGLIRRDIETLKKIPFHVILFDEAQAVKNIYADTTGAVRQLQGYFKVVMTGTPLENHLGEYFSLIDLCLPGLLGEYDDFKTQTSLERSPVIDLLVRRTRPFVMRRTKEAILKELPPKTESDIYLELTPRQKALYQLTVEQVKGAIDSAYRNKTQAQAQIIALTAILKLRQLCVSPRLITREPGDHSPKIAFLVQQLQELMEEGHSALVFSQFTSFLDIVEEDLKCHSIPYLRLDGSTPTGKRKKLVEGFQEGETPAVFLLSLKAGGQGLNLTRASYVFHLDPWWNPAVENQASDRAHRIGQKNKVSIVRILMRHTIEEKMMALKSKKQALYKAVMEDAGGGKAFKISKTDFDFLLGG